MAYKLLRRLAHSHCLWSTLDQLLASVAADDQQATTSSCSGDGTKTAVELAEVKFRIFCEIFKLNNFANLYVRYQILLKQMSYIGHFSKNLVQLS